MAVYFKPFSRRTLPHEQICLFRAINMDESFAALSLRLDVEELTNRVLLLVYIVMRTLKKQSFRFTADLAR